MKRTLRRLAGVACGIWLGASCGCGKPLFSPEDERSPFDRFELVRNKYEPQYVEDEWGRRTPNLRGRLLPDQ